MTTSGVYMTGHQNLLGVTFALTTSPARLIAYYANDCHIMPRRLLLSKLFSIYEKSRTLILCIVCQQFGDCSWQLPQKVGAEELYPGPT